MPTNTPLISVLLPVYNAERYVGEAVQSILAQTLGDFELIVIDDGSKDSSLAILKSYAAKDGRVRLISRPNAGYTKTLNEAIALARGEFVARMDADDVSLPERFELQVQYLRANPKCVALGSRVLMMDRDGETLCEWGTLQTHDEIDDANMKCGGPAIIHPAAMFRRQAMLAVGGYNDAREPIEDLDLFIRLAEIGELANLPDALTKWRQHPQSVCATRFEQMRKLMPVVLGDAYRRRGLTGSPPSLWQNPDGQERADHHLKWAWWALNDRRVSAARKHSFTALRLRPFSPVIWRAVACAVRGH